MAGSAGRAARRGARLCPAVPGSAPLPPPLLSAGRAAAASTEPPTSGASTQPAARGSGRAERDGAVVRDSRAGRPGRGACKYRTRRRQDRSTAPAGSGGTSRRHRPQTLFSARFPLGWRAAPARQQAGGARRGWPGARRDAGGGGRPQKGRPRVSARSGERSSGPGGERGWSAIPALRAGRTHLQPTGESALGWGL